VFLVALNFSQNLVISFVSVLTVGGQNIPGRLPLTGGPGRPRAVTVEATRAFKFGSGRAGREYSGSGPASAASGGPGRTPERRPSVRRLTGRSDPVCLLLAAGLPTRAPRALALRRVVPRLSEWEAGISKPVSIRASKKEIPRATVTFTLHTDTLLQTPFGTSDHTHWHRDVGRFGTS
jgi:hypothetical protein